MTATWLATGLTEKEQKEIVDNLLEEMEELFTRYNCDHADIVKVCMGWVGSAQKQFISEELRNEGEEYIYRMLHLALEKIHLKECATIH